MDLYIYLNNKYVYDAFIYYKLAIYASMDFI